MFEVNKAAEVPLIPYDLGYEETLLHLIKSLDCLDKVVDAVYTHVRSNIKSQKCEIEKLNSKLTNVANKVKNLPLINKSIQVYSSSKYPATHCYKDYNYCYNFDVKSNIVADIQVVHKVTVPIDPSKKLQFFNVDLPVKRSSKNRDILQRKGIGNIPDNINYISSLLLFNSNENLYKNYTLLNSYKTNPKIEDKKTEQIQNLNKPVFTLPLNETENQFNYSYTPVYEEIPSIDVPTDLPDLPGIAGDTICSEKVNNDILIVCPQSTIADLPSFDELDHLKSVQVISYNSATCLEENTKINEDLKSIPPVNFIKTTNDDIELVKNDLKSIANLDNVNTHSILMDEIRNAGGMHKAKLRPVDHRKSNYNEVPTGDGLMADLHKKLAMRRQGISGSNKQNDSGLEGVIYRMATKMLPPDSESENDIDENNETDGDWDD
ncbi:WASH complex subunit 1 [Daktulosphaira vitifoliae]|uniref:WASH complex subunit 1 n=1 Tax=Daktulosphaira vitifoliae TaxID=58002 RepID=UPI0021A9F964|nr:WASH complex subunit 1 [Daktulosphaira vitifoliae]